MTFTKHILPHNSVEAEALRGERDAVFSEFKEHTAALMKMTGWNEGVAMLVMERLILAYEIGAEMRERGGRGVGKKLAAPPEALARPRRAVYALTRDRRAVSLVDHAFLIGWKRNKHTGGGAPKKTAGATVLNLRKRRGKTEYDKRERWRMRKRLQKMVEGFRSRSP